MSNSIAPAGPNVVERAADGSHHAHVLRTGVFFGLAAYTFWGVTPLYFKMLTNQFMGVFDVTVSAHEILAHRIIWSFVFLVGLLFIRRQWGELRAAISNRRTLCTLFVTTALIGINWFVFIWAIEHERLLEASLGYYMNPLVNVLLGFVFLRERLRGGQILALILAGIGVAVMTIASLGGVTFPWPALVLAFSFGFYGLLRKIAPVNGVPGLSFETAILAPIVLVFLVVMHARGDGAFRSHSLLLDGMLILTGLITIFPLICFANAARRLQLATLGFLQYIAPTENFILGALVFHEKVTLVKLMAFVFIWVALVIYSVDTWRWTTRNRRTTVRPAGPTGGAGTNPPT